LRSSLLLLLGATTYVAVTACGDAGPCLRHTDCASEQICSMGRCIAAPNPEAENGDGGPSGVDQGSMTPDDNPDDTPEDAGSDADASNPDAGDDAGDAGGGAASDTDGG
jgi:hypothetical protein